MMMMKLNSASCQAVLFSSTIISGAISERDIYIILIVAISSLIVITITLIIILYQRGINRRKRRLLAAANAGARVTNTITQQYRNQFVSGSQQDLMKSVGLENGGSKMVPPENSRKDLPNESNGTRPDFNVGTEDKVNPNIKKILGLRNNPSSNITRPSRQDGSQSWELTEANSASTENPSVRNLSSYLKQGGSLKMVSSNLMSDHSGGDTTTITMGSGKIVAVPGYLKQNFEKDLRKGRLLGSGTSAEVYEAEIINKEIIKLAGGTSVKAAVKMFPIKMFEDNINHLFEIAILGFIANHPNVIKFLGYCENPCCIIMKLYTSNLKDYLYDVDAPFTLDLFEQFSYQIACGMSHIHSAGVVHFDLKPLNIFLDSVGNVAGSDGPMWRAVIGDFGIAKLVDSGTPIPSVQVVQGIKVPEDVGMTLLYASPELLQLNKIVFVSEIHKKIDVYAYSILMVQMIKRGRPWDRTANSAVAQLVKEGKRPILPEGFLSIVRVNHGYMLDIMESSWSQFPEDRPEFSDIVKRFEGKRPEMIKRCQHINSI